MKSFKKLKNWLGKSPKQTTKRNLSLNMRENDTLSAKNAGLKEGKLESLSTTSLYNDVNTCPLSIYIDIVCDENNLKKLIISGNPTHEELEEAKLKLITDFAELSNAGETKVLSEVIGNLYYQRNIILGYELSMKLISGGRFDVAIPYLNTNQLKCTEPKTEEELKQLLKSIEIKLRNRIAKYKVVQGQYRDLTSKKGEKPTKRYYNKLLVMLSTCEAIKMQLNPKQLTVAEFAEYINLFNEYNNHLKMRNNSHVK